MKPLITYVSLIASISRDSLDSLGSLRASDSLIPLWARLTYETHDPLVAHGALRSPVSYCALGSLRACVPLEALEALEASRACVPLEALEASLSRCSLRTLDPLGAREALRASLPCCTLRTLEPLRALEALGASLP